MINIVISPEGEIVISQEPTEERVVMNNVWNFSEGELPETISDDIKADMFKRGWNSALEEVILNRKAERLDEFLEETGAVKPTDPHHNEPEGTGEDISEEEAMERKRIDDNASLEVGYDEEQSDFRVITVDGAVSLGIVADDVPAAGWAVGDTITSEKIASGAANFAQKIRANSPGAVEASHAANEIGLDVIRPVKDSGEPEKEAEIIAADYNEGTWTMSNAELNSRINAGYQRGLEDADKTKPITTQRALDTIAIEVNNQVLQSWEEENSSDESARGENLTKGEYARRFAATLAKRLGWDVAS